jgi:4-diphosphocytidyl-2-C-methyl-D-erythritol kinase
MIIKARAKINLSLDILGTRPDGYHDILTVMHPLELHDRLEIEALPTDVIEVACSHPDVPAGPGNLVYRAAELLRGECGCSRGASIFIKKNIPVAAGLAGGSADAAAVLTALNKIWGLGLEKGHLLRIGEKIGADVPFCLAGTTALAGGKGELLTPLPPFPGLGVVLVKPPFGVSTASIYSLFDSSPGGAAPDTGAMVKAIKERDYRAVAALLGNVLEPVTASVHPEIYAIKKTLAEAGASGALMSGSGPTVFGLCPSPGEALSVAARLDLPGCRVIVNETV